jgi:hypothetical protein
MALWGISTTTETSANNYAIPKHLSESDRNNTPWNCFADVRGWVYRRYNSSEYSGLSTDYYDEVLVNVAGLNTAGSSTDTGATGLNAATPVAVFFEDPNLSQVISVGAGGTTGIGTGRTGYVHVVWNEGVYCSAGATVLVNQFTSAGVATGTAIVATAASVAPNSNIAVYTNDSGIVLYNTFNGQITNRVAFAFTAPNTGIGTVLRINMNAGVVGTITDFSGGGSVTKTFTSDILRNVGGAGTAFSVHGDTGLPVGIGTTTLTITA